MMRVELYYRMVGNGELVARTIDDGMKLAYWHVPLWPTGWQNKAPLTEPGHSDLGWRLQGSLAYVIARYVGLDDWLLARESRALAEKVT